MSSLYLSTAQTSKLAGVPLGTIYTSFNRHGHFEGITPRKNPSGRLIWPAAEVRARFSRNTIQPPGLDEFVSLTNAVAPELDPHGLAHLGRAFLGSEAVPGWEPAPGQLDPKRLAVEAAVLGLALQAWSERWDQACTEAGGTVAEAEQAWLSQVLAAKFPQGGSHE